MDSYVTLSEKNNVEHSWVCAVNPDYHEHGAMEALTSTVKHKYKSFIRARLLDLFERVLCCPQQNESCGVFVPMVKEE